MPTIKSVLSHLVTVKAVEIRALLISCCYFFLILCAYYIIRPIRNEMIIANGVDNIPWLMLMVWITLIIITPVFGWVTTRFRTRQFLSYCTLFFASHLVVFFFFFDVEQRSPIVTRAFYIWVNVFNMFIVSLFWSFMNDIYSREQSKRIFGFIAAGGTAGAICGPIITTSLVEGVGLGPLLLISAFALSLSVICITWLTRWQNEEFIDDTEHQKHRNDALEGGVLGAFKLIIRSPYLIGICLLITLYAMSITFVEIQQAKMVEQTFDIPTQRTKLFSTIDLSANVLAIILQIFITSRIIQWFGFRLTLMLIPVCLTIAFGFIAFMPTLAIMVGIDIFRRSGDYAIMKPAREILFSVVSREEKYKAKNFIDTAVLRGGSTAGGLGYTAASVAGLSIGGISVALGLAWCATAFWLGGQFNKKQKEQTQNSTS